MAEARASADPGRDTARTGWASGSLNRALQVAVLTACLLWNGMLAVAVFHLDHGSATAELVLSGCYLTVAVTMALALGRRIPLAVPVIAQLALTGPSWLLVSQVDGPAALAAAWTWDFSFLAATFLLGRLGTVASGVTMVAVPTLVVLLHPSWPPAAVIAIAVTPPIILVVAKLALRGLRAFAARIDESTLEAERGRIQAEAASTARRETAEKARTLHDTAVNTLGAIASGGAAIRDLPAVRERCTHDVVVLRAVLSGDDTAADARSRWSLPDRAAGGAIEVVRTGLSDDDLEYVAASVAVSTRQAVARACGELLQNAARHSGADTVRIEARLESASLVIVVSDAGRGFEGPLPAGHGLAESVLGRLADARVAVEVDSHPGAGTRVTLRCPLDDDGHDDGDGGERSDGDGERGDGRGDPRGVQAMVDALRRRAGLAWAFGIAAGGVLLSLTDDPARPKATWAMLALGALLGAFVLIVRRSGRLRTTALVVVLAAVPLSYLLGFAGVGFGHDNVVPWQALGPSIPLVLVLVLSTRLVDFLAGLVLLAVTAGATAALVATAGEATAAAALIGAAAPLVVGLAWLVFYRGLAGIARRAEAEEREAERLRRRRASREALDASRARWRSAGLSGALSVLTRIAEGIDDPADPGVRELCDREESYVRQLIQLSPDAIHLGAWFAAVLREAHERDIAVAVRGGDADVDGETAASLGEALLGMVHGAPSGSSFVVGSFTRDGRPLVTVLGPARYAALGDEGSELARTWHAARQVFGTDCIVELSPRESLLAGRGRVELDLV